MKVLKRVPVFGRYIPFSKSMVSFVKFDNLSKPGNAAAVREVTKGLATT